jgi:NADH-quinone oxidoreductase subunit G
MGESRPDWQIVAQVGERVGLGKPAYAASLVFRDIARAVPQYKQMDYRTLARVEKQWPDVGGVDLYYGGTAYENSQGLGQQWPAAAETGSIDPYPGPADSLSAGEANGALRVITTPALYAAGILINHTELLSNRIARPALLLQTGDAEQLAVAGNDAVTVTLDGVDIEATVTINGAAPPGVALLHGAASRFAGQSGKAVIKKVASG